MCSQNLDVIKHVFLPVSPGSVRVDVRPRVCGHVSVVADVVDDGCRRGGRRRKVVGRRRRRRHRACAVR